MCPLCMKLFAYMHIAVPGFIYLASYMHFNTTEITFMENIQLSGSGNKTQCKENIAVAGATAMFSLYFCKTCIHYYLVLLTVGPSLKYY